MKRRLLMLFAMAALLISMPMQSAFADGGGGHGKGRGHGNGHGRGVGFGRGHSFGHGQNFGRGHGFGGGFGLGFGGGVNYGWDLAELYRELHHNIPHFALHPPVYYSRPVPRTYGYSPFAYPPGVMTPEIVGDVEAMEIINPHVPASKAEEASAKKDKTAADLHEPQPVVIVNPFVTAVESIARN